MNRDVLLTLLARLISLGAGIASSVLTARYLGPAGRGEYFYIVTLAATATQFGNFGLQSSNTYIVATNRALLGRLFANSLWVSALIGGAVALLLVLAESNIRGPDVQTSSSIWLVLIMAPLTLFFMLGSNLLVGIGRLPAFNYLQIASTLLLLGLLLAAALAGFQVRGFLAVSAAVSFVSAAALFILFRRDLNFWFDWEVFGRAYRYGLKAYGATLLGFLLLRGGVFLVSRYADPDQLGHYSVAMQIFDVLAIIPSSVALVLFPALVREQQQHRWTSMISSLLKVGALMFVAALVTAFAAAPFIRLMFGDAFLPAVEIVWWMLPGAFFLALITILSQYLAAIGFPKQMVVIWLVGVVVTFLAGRLLVEKYSAVGVGAALSVAYAITFILLLLLARKCQLKSQA